MQTRSERLVYSLNAYVNHIIEPFTTVLIRLICADRKKGDRAISMYANSAALRVVLAVNGDDPSIVQFVVLLCDPKPVKTVLTSGTGKCRLFASEHSIEIDLLCPGYAWRAFQSCCVCV